MKQNYIAAAACVLSLVACSKTELEEGVSAPKGEAVTLTVPQTKVALAGNYLDFEGDETIYAVATNGSTAELRNSSSTRGTFTGVFSEPVVDGSTISLYYNQASVDSDGTASYAQNGKPWLQALRKTFGRTGDGQISLTATLTAPAGVTAVAVATDGTGIETLEFHSKNGTAISSFDGKTFSGDPYVSQSVLVNKTSETKNCNIIYVPDGMEGGYWIKAVKDGQAMYKSYSSDKAVTQDSKVTIKEFVPASMAVNAEFSGFQTSYSYYAGIDGVQKDITTANGMKNSEIKSGTVTVTPKFSGVSSKLVTFKSIELLINGTKVGDAQTTAADSYTFAVPEVSEWGEKKLSVKVTYAIQDGSEISAESAESTTRYITGLPYKMDSEANPTDWILSNNGKCNGLLTLKRGDAYAITKKFSIIDNVNISVALNAYAYGGSVPRDYKPTVSIVVSESAQQGTTLTTLSGTNLLPGQATFTSISNNLTLSRSISRICIFTKGTGKSYSTGLTNDLGVVCKTFTVNYR